MSYVKSFDMFGAEAKQIPNIVNAGAPTSNTAGAVGCLYMDSNSGKMYKCVAKVGTVYTWEEIIEGTASRGALIGYEPPTKDTEASLFANLSNEIVADTVTTPSMESIIGNILIKMMNNDAVKYETIAAALSGEGTAPGTGNVLRYTTVDEDGNEVVHIMLLADIASENEITINKDCILHLNGYTLSFTTAAAFLNITSNKITIDGTVAGSKIIKENITASDIKFIFTNTSTINIIGGEYILQNIVYNGSSTGFAAIRCGNTTNKAKLTLTKCSVKVTGEAPNVYGIQCSDITEITDCSMIFKNTKESTGSGVRGIYCVLLSKLTMTRSTIEAESLYSSGSNWVVGISGIGADITLNNCKISAISATTEASCFGAYVQRYDQNNTTQDSSLTVTNCCIKSYNANGSRVAAIGTSSYSVSTINGGYYGGAMYGLENYGITTINTGIFEGAQYGCYMGGGNVQVNNAIINVNYTGYEDRIDQAEWNRSAIYSENAELTFDNCLIGTAKDNKSKYGINVQSNAVYISNCKINGSFEEADIYSKTGSTINIGKNVVYNSNDINGTINISEDEYSPILPSSPNSLLSVKDKLGNWIAIPV